MIEVVVAVSLGECAQWANDEIYSRKYTVAGRMRASSLGKHNSIRIANTILTHTTLYAKLEQHLATQTSIHSKPTMRNPKEHPK